ncbi:glucosyltransferase, putative [Babesia ovis]|uniref:Glucosyltransferase, putative n=1 Tax=Babesia ovis TaxID=5869 RepID=A0A9W5TAA7_BABOV|nr:glucosyltransferase, putative [Babesia ovis]
MLPSFNLGVTNEDMRTMLIGGQKKRTRYVILEAQELVKHFVPDMITVKRLICDETKRKDLEEAVKRVCEVTHLPIRSTLIDIIKSWKRRSHNGNAFAEYRQCVQLIKGYEIMKQVEGNAVERDDVRQTMQAENSDHGEKETVSSFNQNVPQWDKTNRRFTGDGIEEVHKVCKGIMEEFERGKGKGFAPKRLCTATTFVTRVYSLSGFMPKTTEFDKLQIGELLELDFLPSHANQEVIRPRLSEPFNIFNGNHYRMMFRNLKELSNVKVLSNRL